VKKVSIGVQFLFAAQKDDRDSGDQGTVRMLEQWLSFGRWKLVLAYSSYLLRKRMTAIVRMKAYRFFAIRSELKTGDINIKGSNLEPFIYVQLL